MRQHDATLRQPPQSERAKATAIMKRHPDWKPARVAAEAGVSLRTAQRAKEKEAKP